eukprot:1124269-Prymnesium_polylepis.1
MARLRAVGLYCVAGAEEEDAEAHDEVGGDVRDPLGDDAPILMGQVSPMVGDPLGDDAPILMGRPGEGRGRRRGRQE